MYYCGRNQNEKKNLEGSLNAEFAKTLIASQKSTPFTLQIDKNTNQDNWEMISYIELRSILETKKKNYTEKEYINYILRQEFLTDRELIELYKNSSIGIKKSFENVFSKELIPNNTNYLNFINHVKNDNDLKKDFDNSILINIAQELEGYELLINNLIEEKDHLSISRISNQIKVKEDINLLRSIYDIYGIMTRLQKIH